MSDEDIRAALRRGATAAPDADGLWKATHGRVRRHRQRRWATQAGAAAVVLAGGLGVGLSVVDEPSADVAFDNGAATDDGWVDVDAATARISVPGHWRVIDVDEHVTDAGEPGERVDPHSYCPLPDDRPVLFVGTRTPAACTDGANAQNPQSLPLEQGVDPLAPELPDGANAQNPPSLPPGLTLTTGSAAVAQHAQAVLGESAPTPVDDSGQPDGPSDGSSWDAAERRDVGEAAALAVATGADAGEVVLVAPALDVAATTRGSAHTEEIGEVLDTLRAAGEPDHDAVVIGERWPHGRPDFTDPAAGDDTKPLSLWALDADARLHEWHETTVVTGEFGEQGTVAWPGANAERFARLVRTGGEVRLLAARPGEEAREVFTYPDSEMVPKADAWSPSGDAVVWIDRDELTAGLAAWDDADAVVDGEPPAVEQHVAVEGAEHPEYGPGVGGLAWDGDAGVLRDTGWGQAAELERDAAGRPRLPDPLRFSPDDARE